MKKILIFTLVFLTLFMNTVFGAGELEFDFPAEQGMILYDIKGDRVLYSQNDDDKYYPASTTKLITALTALDYLGLDDSITVGEEINLLPANSSKADLVMGEKISFKDLLAGLILPSGNDAANVIAVNAARKANPEKKYTSSEAIDVFGKMMTEKASKLGAKKSNFVNPHGLQDDNHYSTPADMLIITKAVLKNDTIRTLVKTVSYEVGGKIPHTFVNTNIYLHKKLDEIAYLNAKGTNKDYNPAVTGVKTGFTNQAGRCVIFSASKAGIDLIGIIYKSDMDSIWSEGSQMMNRVFDKMVYMDTFKKGGTVTSLALRTRVLGAKEKAKVICQKKVVYLIDSEEAENVKEKVTIDESKLKEMDGYYQVVNDIPKGEIIGKLEYFSGDQLLAAADLSLDTSV
ncbi:MAG: D-alanyl-D-alanine carboxypeptidase, partial [Eubacteriaceae bacterium]|nr:D-alanyl-D-alanine carboxypeptidase [Eubacteriaceae bacterium]